MQPKATENRRTVFHGLPRASAVIRSVFLVTLILLAACSDPASEESAVDRARRHLADGQYELAVVALRDAMRAYPDDPELRLLLAEAYLDLEQGNLALKALEQAIERGLEPMQAVLPTGRALFLERRWGELIALDLPTDLDVAEQTMLLYLQANAKAAQSTVGISSDDMVIRAYIDLIGVIEANAGNAEVAALRDLLQERREERSEIERAWHHYACSGRQAETGGWMPIISPGNRVLTVGTGKEFETLGGAAKSARDGDVVEIFPGTYTGGVALWPQSDLIVRGVGERPRVIAGGKSIEHRDVWLFTGDNVVIENVDISGARSPWKNGAGIRHTGSGLTLRHVFLHDNENGVLTSNRYPDTNTILVEYSEFANNGDNEGFAHNLYIGRSKRFEFRYSYSHGSKGGHLLKSRAQENHVTYNRLTDEQGGRSSYIIDIPEGGTSYIVGNVIEQGSETLNHGIFSFAGESSDHPDNRLVIVNNSIYNRDFKGVVVRNHASLDVEMVNNLLGGAPAANTDSVINLAGNLTRPEHGMTDPRNYDFSLKNSAAAIDAGVEFEIVPSREYVHPVRWRNRQTIWILDVGAYERCGID
jgi:hypothetical protein